MSVTSRNPLRMAGATLNSGFPNTGELQLMRGGQLKGVVWSGSVLTVAAFGGVPGAVVSGGHIQFWSGAGRLNAVLPHLAMQSGQPVFFYDATGITISGVSVSGQNIIPGIPALNQPYMTAGFQSGGGNPPWSWRYDIDAPFLSGLCAAIPSGSPGFTVLFTPETNLPNPG